MTGIRVKKYMCGILEEMRTLDKIKNYAPLASLIEELQVVGNRMEGGLQRSKSTGLDIQNTLDNKDMLNTQKLAKIRKLVKKRWDFKSDDDLVW